MIALFTHKVTIRITLDEVISDEMFNEIEGLTPDGIKLSNNKPIKDGIRFRHKYEFKTTRLDPFLRHLTTYKGNNPHVDIHTEFERTIHIPDFLNIKHLLFPTRVTIRYTLDHDTDPKDFKDYLQSSLPDEELSETVDISDENYKRFKINFKISDLETFERNFEIFRSNRPNYNISSEFEKRTIRSYFNVVLYIGTTAYVVLRLIEFLGWLEPLKNILE